MSNLGEDEELERLRLMARGETLFKVSALWESLAALDLKQFRELPVLVRLGLGYYVHARTTQATPKAADARAPSHSPRSFVGEPPRNEAYYWMTYGSAGVVRVYPERRPLDPASRFCITEWVAQHINPPGEPQPPSLPLDIYIGSSAVWLGPFKTREELEESIPAARALRPVPRSVRSGKHSGGGAN